jgi:hypothetical protein
MSIKRDELKTAVATITPADANVGSAVPANMFRFIYKLKVTNLFAGANLLTLGKRENGAGATTVIDYVQAATQYETWNDPDELKEDAAPLYIIGGKGSTGDSYVRAVTNNGNAYLTLWYVDAPA